MKKVSVLIPVYNAEKYLVQCIESVLNQTLSDIEIICINDGSTDNSLQILQEYAMKDHRIKTIDKKNTGYGYSMNVGLKEASGEYIGIVESDDFSEENMFEVLYEHAKENDADVVKSNYYAQKGEKQEFVEPLLGEKYNCIYNPNSVTTILYETTPSIWSAIYKREFLLKNDIWFNETPGASYQDVSFYFKTLFCVERLYLLRSAYLHYRTDNTNSSVRSKEKVKCIFDEFLEVKHFLKKHRIFEERYKKIILAKAIHYMGNYKRVDDKHKLLFLTYAADDLYKDYEAGILQEFKSKISNWDFIEKLVTQREIAFFEAYLNCQKDRLYIKGVLNELQESSDIYIYGAGKVGSFVAEYLLRKNIEIKGFLVSSAENNAKFIGSLNVYPLNEITYVNKEKIMILVSVKESDQYEIITSLKEQGFENIVSMNSELRMIMV